MRRNSLEKESLKKGSRETERLFRPATGAGEEKLAVQSPEGATIPEEMAAVGALPPGGHFPGEQRPAERYNSSNLLSNANCFFLARIFSNDSFLVSRFAMLNGMSEWLLRAKAEIIVEDCPER